MRCVKDRVYWGVPADWGWLHVAAKTLQMNLHSFDTGCLPWFAHFERFEGMKIALNGARIVEHAFPSPLRAWQQQVKSAQKVLSIPYATISNLALVHSLCFDCRVVGPKNVLSPPGRHQLIDWQEPYHVQWTIVRAQKDALLCCQIERVALYFCALS